MSEAQAAIDTATSAGHLLRQAREHAGLHVAALAGALKVPQRQLEALEQDRLDLLPDVVYARALAASVCRNLRVDPQIVLARLPKGEDSRLGKGEQINVPFRASGDVVRSPARDLLTRPPVMVALALLVGAVVLLLLPLIPNRSADPVPAAEGTVPAVGNNVPSTPSAPVGMVSETVTPSGAGGAASIPPAPATGAVPGVGVATPATPAAGTVATVPTAPVASAADASVIEVRASQPAWVQITDSRGTSHVRRTLAAGETINVPASAAALPLNVVVGNVNTTQVQVRGKPYELRSVTRDNVARFEIR